MYSSESGLPLTMLVHSGEGLRKSTLKRCFIDICCLKLVSLKEYGVKLIANLLESCQYG